MKLKDLPAFLNVMEKADTVPMLWGDKGIGKSAGVQSYVKSQGIHMIDLRLGVQSDNGDLIGLPRVREVDGEHVTIWAKPEWWKEMEKYPRGILFLDEFNRASSTEILQAMFPLVLGERQSDGTIIRRLHTHILPPGWRIVCAGNPDTSDYSVQTLDTAMLSRLVQVVIEPNHKDTVDYFRENFKDKSIIDFVATDAKTLGKKNQILIQASPDSRAYEFLDRILSVMSDDDYAAFGYDVLIGCLGKEMGETFYLYRKENVLKPIPATRVLNNRNWDKFVEEELAKILTKETKHIELLNVTLQELAQMTQNTKYSQKQLQNLTLFLKVIPPDMAVQFMKECLTAEHGEDIFLSLVDEEELLIVWSEALGLPREEFLKAKAEMEKLAKQYESEASKPTPKTK